jgi:hypothetical protein
MTAYKHTQRGTVIIVSMLAMTAMFVVLGVTVARQLLITSPLLLIALWLFHSLTVEIDDEKLRWRFGPGIISKSVPLTEIVSARVVRTNFIEGWGIHLSRFGWLYNVSGQDAVAIVLKNGKPFALGTDEPAALVEAINRGTGVHSR